MRSRDLFYALWIPDLFMERVEKDETWSLMCPSVCDNLVNLYGNDFNDLYIKNRIEKVNAQYIKDNEALERKLRDARNNRLRKSKTKSIKKRP